MKFLPNMTVMLLVHFSQIKTLRLFHNNHIITMKIHKWNSAFPYLHFVRQRSTGQESFFPLGIKHKNQISTTTQMQWWAVLAGPRAGPQGAQCPQHCSYGSLRAEVTAGAAEGTRGLSPLWRAPCHAGAPTECQSQPQPERWPGPETQHGDRQYQPAGPVPTMGMQKGLLSHCC